MQSLAGINVSTTVRMTVVKLRSGGLWVHAPIAPSRHATVSESAREFLLRVVLCLLDLLASSRVGVWAHAPVAPSRHALPPPPPLSMSTKVFR